MTWTCKECEKGNHHLCYLGDLCACHCREETIEDIIGDMGRLIGSCATLTNGKTIGEVKPPKLQTTFAEWVKQIVDREIERNKVKLAEEGKR